MSVSTVETAAVIKDSDGILIMNDTTKGTTIGDPDGPLVFIDSLGCKVPTYVDPRNDLITDLKIERRFERLSYHVPYKLRGYFKFYDWPEEYRNKIIERFGGLVNEGVENGFDRIGAGGYVLCSGVCRASVPARGFVPGTVCKKKAVNRTMFCAAHGGALHLADKKISNRTLMPISQDRIERLDRVQKFMQGFLSVEDLDDDEIQGNFVRNDKGVPIKARQLDYKFEAEIAKELHVRLNRYLREKSGSMLEVMVNIAENDLYEAADRIKAAQWVVERTMGKTPDIVLHGKAEAPYEAILDSMESGSREDHRKRIASTRLSLDSGGGNESSSGRKAFEEIVDAKFEEIMEGEDDESEEDFEDDVEEDSGGMEEGAGENVRDAGENVRESSDVYYGGEQSESELSVLERENGTRFEQEFEGNWIENDEHVKTSSQGVENSEGEGEESQFEGPESFGGALSGNSEDGIADIAREIDRRKARAKEQRDRIQKAKKRRFAARASGAKYLPGGLDGKDGTGWWLHEFVGINQMGKFQLKLWPPERQSPAIVRRAEASHAPVDEAMVASQQAERLDAEAARLEAQLAALKGN